MTLKCQDDNSDVDEFETFDEPATHPGLPPLKRCHFGLDTSCLGACRVDARPANCRPIQPLSEPVIPHGVDNATGEVAVAGVEPTYSGPDASAQCVGQVARLSRNVPQPNHVLAD